MNAPTGSMDDIAEHYRNLNPEQRTAVEHVEGPILVLAGAGSGKTRVLTVRIARLIREHGVPPERILSVTFTNKAAGEMRERVRAILGHDPIGSWMGTFHSLGARFLRRHADLLGWDSTFTIFDADESLREIKRVTERLDLDPKRWKPKAVRAALSDAKNRLITPGEFKASHEAGFDLFMRTVSEIYPEYQKSLRDQNAFDFDDLLVKPVEILDSHPGLLQRYRDRFAFILVDEYQDTNHAQFRFLELLAAGHHNLMVVGDDDQSIYGWRGADIRNILDFERSYPGAEVVRLEENYRSTSVILEAANQVIRRNVHRKEKTLRTAREEGARLTLVETADERDEARWIVEEVEALRSAEETPRMYGDISILYRTNAQSRALEDAFRRRGVPYQIVGGVRFYERREIQDVLAYLRLISNPRDAGAFLRVVNYPKRGIGKTSQGRLVEWAGSEGLTLLEAAARADEAPNLPKGATRSLLDFAGRIATFAERAQELAVGNLLEEVIEDLDLLQNLRDEGPEGEDRAENVKELIAGALEFDVELAEEWEGAPPEHFTELDLFLQQIALVTDLDRADDEADTVTFMTLHNAKGLEFPVVFIAGLEDGLFPMGRAWDDPTQLEEERRLFYVGITRAEDRLYLTHARERRRAGDFMFGKLSSFVDDIPEQLLEMRRSPRLERERASFSGSRGRGGGDGFGSTAGAEAARKRHEEEVFEAGLNQDAPHLGKGARVSHKTFGSGTVVDVTGFGRDVKVTVDFDTVGEKKLLARYAGLEREF